MSACVGVRPAEVLRRCRPSTPGERGISGQADRPIRSGLTACHTSTNGCPTTSTCWPTAERATSSAIRLSLEPGHEVVDEHADPALRSGTEVAEVAGEVVDAAEVLDDDALEAQVVTPDLLDELGVVPALDEDPAGPGHLGPGAVDGHRAGGGAGRPGRRRLPDRGAQDDGPALQEEARPERERTPPAAAVLEGERVQVAVDRDDLAAPVGGDLLDHQRRGRRRRRWRGPRLGTCQSVASTSVP